MGLKLKLEETWASNSLFLYRKVPILNKRMEGLWAKGVSRLTTCMNDELPSLACVLSNMATQCLTISQRLYDPVLSMVVYGHAASDTWDRYLDYISTDTCTVRYASLDELARFIFRVRRRRNTAVQGGRAFKLIPVRPDQHAALGFCWDGRFYYQTALPFGCRASPRLFNEFPDLLRDALRAASGNPAVLNYLHV